MTTVTLVATDEVWYCWRILVQLPGEPTPRLLVPNINVLDDFPLDHPFDSLYGTADEARVGLIETFTDFEQGWGPPRNTDYEQLLTDGWKPPGDWRLCRMTLTEIR